MPKCVKQYPVCLTIIALLIQIFASIPSVSAQNQIPIPSLSQWESNMANYGARHCEYLKTHPAGYSDPHLAATYYDAEWVYYQIGDYTGNYSYWNSCAAAAEYIYRDTYSVPNNGIVPGYWNFTHGLMEDYLRMGDAASRTAAIQIAKNGAYAVDGTSLSSTAASTMSREVAYIIMAYLNAETLGEPRRARLSQLVDQAFGHIDQWAISKTAPYVRPFMVALTAHALMSWYEVSGDARVLPALKTAADYIWNTCWIPSAGAFYYTDRDIGVPEDRQPAPDLNLLIAPLYAWLYHQTGDVVYRDRGDQVFAGGVSGAYLTGAKQFNQSYRLSFKYVELRKLDPMPGRVVPTQTPVPTATRTPVPTATRTPAPTSTIAPTSTRTPAPTSTRAPSSTATPLPTSTFTPRPTLTFTPQPTSTFTPVSTATTAPARTVVPIPQLAKWESNMTTYGNSLCNYLKGRPASFSQTYLNATNYDAQWVFQQISDYTRNPNTWNPCAQAAEYIYRDTYTSPANGAVPAGWNFSHGLVEDALRASDATSRNAAIKLSTNATYAADSTPLSSTASANMSVETANTILSYLNAEKLGQPRRARLTQLVDQALGHINQWAVAKNAAYVRPYMVGLTAHALISWYEVSGDARVLPALKSAADYIWTTCWAPSSSAFYYTDRNTGDSYDRTAAPDLNLLVAPMYAWIYYQTGDDSYRDRADQVFAGGVNGAYLSGYKQFNQNYRLSFKYVELRKKAPLAWNQQTPAPTATVVPTTTNTPAPTNTVQPTATRTPAPTNTVQPTATRTPAPTNTVQPTATRTPMPTATTQPAFTATPRPTSTPAPTGVPSNAYYVATTGSDTASGTASQPWKTIQNALSRAPAGAVIMVRGGTYNQALTISKAVTLQSYPGEKAYITQPYASGNGHTIVLSASAQNVTLKNLDISGGYYYSLKLDSAFDNQSNPSGKGASNVLIDSCVIHDSGSHIVKLSPETNYVTIRNSEFYNSGKNGKAQGIDAVNSNWLTIQNSYLHNITGDAIFAKGGSAYTIIERNLIDGADSGILLGQDTGSTFFNLQRNPSRYESMYGVARNNIVMNTRYSGVGSYSGLQPKIYNNTLINVSQTGQAALYFPANNFGVKGNGAQVINNIVSVPSGRALVITSNGLSDTPVMKNNLYFRSSGSTVVFTDNRAGFSGGLSQWKTRTNQDTGSLEANPQVDASGHIASTSPGLNAGTTITSFSDDYDGQARGTPWDIGADEK